MHLMELESDKKIWLQPSLKHYLAFWLDVLLGKKTAFLLHKTKTLCFILHCSTSRSHALKR